MSVFHSKISVKQDQYIENRDQMIELIVKLNTHLKESRYQGKEKHIEKARLSGKLTARERVELLLDRDSFFLELMPLIGLEGEGFGPGGTTVSGLGLVCGRLCMINANVGTNKGGAIDKATLQKTIRISQIEISKRSKKGLTTISVVFGNSTAGGAYVPGMSDYAIFVKNNANVFLAGPPLVKMATGEIVDEETLGGAEMHSKISGVSDYLTEDEYDALRLAREIIMTLPEEKINFLPEFPVKEPLYNPEEILTVVPANIKIPFDSREIIARIVDGSEFTEFKPDYGPTLVCAFSKIGGYPVGIISNNGVIFS